MHSTVTDYSFGNIRIHSSFSALYSFSRKSDITDFCLFDCLWLWISLCSSQWDLLSRCHGFVESKCTANCRPQSSLQLEIGWKQSKRKPFINHSLRSANTIFCCRQCEIFIQKIIPKAVWQTIHFHSSGRGEGLRAPFTVYRQTACCMFLQQPAVKQNWSNMEMAFFLLCVKLLSFHPTHFSLASWIPYSAYAVNVGC